MAIDICLEVHFGRDFVSVPVEHFVQIARLLLLLMAAVLFCLKVPLLELADLQHH